MIVSGKDGWWIKNEFCTSRWLLHISSCGYAVAYPQKDRRVAPVFLFFSLTLVLAKARSSRKTKPLDFFKFSKIFFEPSFSEQVEVCVFGIAGEAARIFFLLFVYLKEMYTSIVVMVNAGTFLWIRP